MKRFLLCNKNIMIWTKNGSNSLIEIKLFN
jgi:hypothetical protein